MTAEDLATADETPSFPSGDAPDGQHAARKAAARAFRPRRAGPAIVVSALLAVATGLIAAYLISKYVGHQVHVLPSGLFQAGHQLHWDDQRSLVASGVACALGLVLIGYALRPGRHRVVPVASQHPRSVVAVTRGGLRRYLAGGALTVDGIASAKVRVRRRRAQVFAASSLRDTEGLAAQVETAVNERLAALTPLRPLRVSVSVQKRRD
ncbi:MAG: hypothetical protein JO016_15220 [Actinobacteria bacterium]|nr:hypothetical protein [Actinomycetota bacterium]